MSSPMIRSGSARTVPPISRSSSSRDCGQSRGSSRPAPAAPTQPAAPGRARGGSVLSEAPERKPDVILIGTGSEVSLCIAARDVLKSQGVGARVVSLPSWELFEEQDEAYRESVLPAAVRAHALPV